MFLKNEKQKLLINQCFGNLNDKKCLKSSFSGKQTTEIGCKQVQAIDVYGAAQPDFFKSETNGGIKNIISYHLKIIKRCVFSPNLEVVAQKISLPRP